MGKIYIVIKCGMSDLFALDSIVPTGDYVCNSTLRDYTVLHKAWPFELEFRGDFKFIFLCEFN